MIPVLILFGGVGGAVFRTRSALVPALLALVLASTGWALILGPGREPAEVVAAAALAALNLLVGAGLGRTAAWTLGAAHSAST